MFKKKGGKFRLELIRDGKVIQELIIPNDVVSVGKNYMLDVAFGSTSTPTAIGTWYIGLINNAPAPTLLDADTLASHTGWVELIPGTDYTGNRQAWAKADAAAGVKQSSSSASFAILTSQTIFGIFVCSQALTTAGILWSTAQFLDQSGSPAPMTVNSGDTVRVTYSYTL